MTFRRLAGASDFLPFGWVERHFEILAGASERASERLLAGTRLFGLFARQATFGWATVSTFRLFDFLAGRATFRLLGHFWLGTRLLTFRASDFSTFGWAGWSTLETFSSLRTHSLARSLPRKVLAGWLARSLARLDRLLDRSLNSKKSARPPACAAQSQSYSVCVCEKVSFPFIIL